MSLTLNREAFDKLINEDFTWLMSHPRSLERDHIEQILQWVKDNKRLIDWFDSLQPTQYSKYIVHYPLGSTMYNGEQTDNCEISRLILEALTTGRSFSIPFGVGWNIQQFINGQYVDITPKIGDCND